MKYILTHHRRKYNVSGTNQAPFFCQIQSNRSKLGQKKTPLQCSKKMLNALQYIIKYR